MMAATVGVYALILAGATTAITDAAGTCPTWPACNGKWLVVSSPALVLVWSHRIAALLVGILVTGVTVTAWHQDANLRVRNALTLATVIYPIQIGIGAWAATTHTPVLVSALHLGIGLSLFGLLIVALAWELQPSDMDSGANRPEQTDIEPPTENPTPSSMETPNRPPSVRTRIGAYFRLMKPRLMWLLCLVAAAGMALTAGPALTVETVVVTLSGGVLAIGASGTFNHVLERDRDRAMGRTADRPVVQSVIPVGHAMAFGTVLTIASLMVFLQVNILTAVLGATAIFYYAVVYTLVLKPNTVQNTVIGGFAGALPALIGGAAVTGTIGWAAIGLATIVFLWTPAHFYNLALAYRDDYERGGFPMLPVLRGEAVTRQHILLYLGATLGASAVLAWITALGPVFSTATVVVGSVFLWAVVRLHEERSRTAAFRAFHASNAFLGTVLVAVLVDALVV